MNILVNERILEIRKKHKLSRKGLENISGFKERTIASYERGERSPSNEYILFMSLYFNVSKDYLNGISYKDSYENDISRILKMYQDIYGYDNQTLKNMIEVTEKEISELLNENEIFSRKEEKNKILLLSISESLNIKPSCFGLERYIAKEKILKDEIGALTMYGGNMSEEAQERLSDKVNERNSYIKPLNNRLILQEQKGINLDENYYADIIKKRNIAKENNVTIIETPKFDEKYQKIVDLLPYASDTFLDELRRKLEAMRDIQKL